MKSILKIFYIFLFVPGLVSCTASTDGSSTETEVEELSESISIPDELFEEMGEEEFWEVIDYSIENGLGCLDQVEYLTEALSEREDKEIIQFQRLFDQVMIQSYTSDLWAMAYILNGGCSDDAFEYYRAWLILQGKDFYRMMNNHPESVADDLNMDMYLYDECEPALYMANDAYEKSTGRDDFYEDLSSEIDYVGYGEIEFNWTEENLDSIFPKFYGKFGEYWAQDL